MRVMGLNRLMSTDGRAVKAVDLSPITVMCVGSIPTLCNFYIPSRRGVQEN